MKTQTYRIKVRIVEIRSVEVSVDDDHADMLMAAYDKALDAVKRSASVGRMDSWEATTVPGSHDLLREVDEKEEE